MFPNLPLTVTSNLLTESLIGHNVLQPDWRSVFSSGSINNISHSLRSEHKSGFPGVLIGAGVDEPIRNEEVNRFETRCNPGLP